MVAVGYASRIWAVDSAPSGLLQSLISPAPISMAVIPLSPVWLPEARTGREPAAIIASARIKRKLTISPMVVLRQNRVRPKTDFPVATSPLNTVFALLGSLLPPSGFVCQPRTYCRGETGPPATACHAQRAEVPRLRRRESVRCRAIRSQDHLAAATPAVVNADYECDT